jgi:hypothetical protein
MFNGFSSMEVYCGVLYRIVEGSRIPCTILYISLNNPEFALAFGD